MKIIMRFLTISFLASILLPFSTTFANAQSCLTMTENEALTAKECRTMKYDDHLDVTGKSVIILDAGTPVSYQVGYGIETNTMLDTEVVKLVDNTLIATGIGTAKVSIDDVVYDITVEAAPISLILLAGQSNMQGNDGNANQSIVCPDGMVYATYGDAYKMTASNASNYAPSALTGQYRDINVNGTADGLSTYPVTSLNEEGAGKMGADSGFAYEWVKQTGEKVWVVNTAHGGSSISTWQKTGVNYKETLVLLGACIDTLEKEIAAGHFTFSHMGYYWCQGCADEIQTAQWYVEKYLTMHSNLKTDFTVDHDNDDTTPEKSFEFGGIIPIRSGHQGAGSYRAGVYADTTNASYFTSFKDLRMNGPRVAQYWMGNNPELTDIYNVCTIQEKWATMPDGTDGVEAYFKSAYSDGKVDYPVQKVQNASWYTPKTPADVHDNIHYNQIGYNEIGRESVRNTMIYLGINEPETITASVEFVSWDGFTPVNEITASTAGSSATLAVPVIYPVYLSKDVVYTLSNGLSYNYYDVLADTIFAEGTLKSLDKEITVKSRDLTSYRWSFDGTNLVNDVSCGDSENPLVKVSGSLNNGLFSGTRYQSAQPMALLHDEAWVLEWSMNANTNTAAMIFSSTSSSNSGQPYLYVRGVNTFVGIGYRGASNYYHVGYYMDDFGIEMTKTHVYRLVNRVADDSNMVYLFVDGEEIGPLDQQYAGSTDYQGTSDWISGKDLMFSFMGTSEHMMTDMMMDYAVVKETGASTNTHFHSYSEWIEASAPSKEGPGQESRTCSGCHDVQTRTVNGVWQNLNFEGHLSELPEEFCSKTNLWLTSEHDKYYLIDKGTWAIHDSGSVYSITIPVSEGDKVYATSFGKAGANGHATSNGIRMTWLNDYGIVKTLSPQETYSQFTANGGYLIVPENANYINIPMWNNSDDNEVYILNKEHVYKGAACTICGDVHSEAADYEGKVISILSASTSTFAGYIPVADGFNLEHRSRYPQDNLLTDVNETWWMQIINTLDAKLGINESWAGSQVLNTQETNSGDLGPDAAMASLTRIQNLGANGTPDVILFFGAGNDMGRGVPVGTFNPETAPTEVDLISTKWTTLADAYVAAIMRMQYFYPDAQIVAMTTYAMPSYVTEAKLNQYVPVLKAICDHYGVLTIDLRESGVQFSDLPDDIHPNANGMDHITEQVVETLLSEVDLNKGENTVYSVTHNLTNVKASLGYYKGVSEDKAFVETLDGKNIDVTVTMGGKDMTSSVYRDGTIHIEHVCGDVVITASAKYNFDGHLQNLPEDMCAGVNLWTALEPENIYYTVNGWGLFDNSPNVHSITFPVSEGSQIWATSFLKSPLNGASENATRITWFSETGVLKTVDRHAVYKEFSENGYITVPEGAVALNVPALSGEDKYEVYILNAGHDYVNGICRICENSAVNDDRYTHAVAESAGVQNAIDRAYMLTDLEWTPLADVPGVQKINGEYEVVPFKAGTTYKGIPYSGVIANDGYVGLNVSLETFLTALENENSVLYTENLFSTNPKSATYYGTVCSKFAQYVLDVPGSYNTNNVANIPGMETIALPGQYTVDQIRLGDVVINTSDHTTVCTDIMYDADGKVAFIEISEAVMPLTRRMYWSVEEFYEHFASYRLCRYQYLNEVPAAEIVTVDNEYALMPRNGDKYNYSISTSKAAVDVLKDGYSKAVIKRNGTITDIIELNGTKSFEFDRSVSGHIEMYLVKEDGARSNSVYANVVQSSVKVTDSSEFTSGKLKVQFEGSSGTPLYVQVGSAHAIFCNVEGQTGEVEIQFSASKISTRQVRVAYQNEYGIYLSNWVSFAAEKNPSKDPLLSQGQYWNGYNITPSSPTPFIQEGKEGYWSYTMVPVEENTTYYSEGATRMWFLDENGNGISTINAYKDCEISFQFKTPENTAYVSIAYSPSLIEQGSETLKVVHNYAGKVISIYGDSISTFAGYIPAADGFNLEHLARYPQDNLLTDVNETWWMQVIDKLGGKLGINDSWRGATVSGAKPVTTGTSGENASFANLTRIQNLGSNGTPDVILFYGGTNDLAHVDEVGTFDASSAPSTVDLTTLKWDNLADGYMHTLLRLKHYYPDAVILAMLPTVTSSYYSDEKLIIANAVLKQICDHYDVPYVDLTECGLTVDMLPDGIHPDAEGMDYITNAVLSSLMKQDVEAGEHTVYTVTHHLNNVTASKGHYKGIDAGLSFNETLESEHDMTITVVMGGNDITETAVSNDTISIEQATGNIVITAEAKFSLGTHLKKLPKDLCEGINLWEVLEHDREYYSIDGWTVHASNKVTSVTFAVEEGMKITASSFKKANENGGTVNGIRVTYFTEDGLLKTMSADDVYTEYSANGYLIVPANAAYISIPMWTESDAWEIRIVSLGHEYESVITEPTCTESGYITHTCSECGNSYTDTFIEKLGHDYTIVVTSPTCEDTGYTTYSCVRGDHTYVADHTEALGHNEVIDAAVEATCIETGLTEGKHCDRCAEVLVAQTVTDKLGHDYEHPIVEAKQNGKHELRCGRCLKLGDTVNCDFEQIGHTNSEIGEPGEDRYECRVCHQIKKVEIAPLPEPTPTPSSSKIVRIMGQTRYETSLKIAETYKELLGVDKFDTVILSSGAGYADALAGSYLAAVKNAPIIMVNPKAKNYNDIKSYLAENLVSGGKVYILGGTAAVPSKVESALTGYEVHRLAGADRFKTNLAILNEAGVTDEPILVCYGRNFADSLSASATGLPMLLVEKNKLNAQQKAFLEAHSGNKIYVLGGTAAVSEKVEKELKNYGTVERIAGSSRYSTSIEIAKKFFTEAESAVFAYAQNYPDGLCGGPLAYATKSPLILTDTKNAKSAAAYTASQNIQSGAVLGGSKLISDAAVKQILGSVPK